MRFLGLLSGVSVLYRVLECYTGFIGAYFVGIKRLMMGVVGFCRVL